MHIIQATEYRPYYLEATQKLLNQLVSGDSLLTESYFKEMLSSANTYLFFLYDEVAIIGMFSVGFYQTPSGKKAWLEDVVIEQTYRGQGLGRKLIEQAISFVKLEGADTFMLTSNAKRIAANSLYRSVGFEQRETNVYRMSFPNN